MLPLPRRIGRAPVRATHVETGGALMTRRTGCVPRLETRTRAFSILRDKATGVVVLATTEDSMDRNLAAHPRDRRGVSVSGLWPTGLGVKAVEKVLKSTAPGQIYVPRHRACILAIRTMAGLYRERKSAWRRNVQRSGRAAWRRTKSQRRTGSCERHKHNETN